MLPVVIAFMVLTAFAIIALFGAMLLTALNSKYVHPRLRPLQSRMQAHMAPEWLRNQQLDSAGAPLEEDGLAIFDSLMISEYEPDSQIDLATALRTTGIPTLTSESALPSSEVLLFLRAELAVQLGFDLDIRGTTVNLTHAQYRKLTEYTGFAFTTIETPESYLGQYGITYIHLRSRPSKP